MIAKELIYTYNDYVNFQTDRRIEIIDGKIYNMSPAPNTNHQEISMYLSRQIGNYLEDKACKVYTAPYDVFLIHKDEDIENCNNIVQPDLLVICDKNKIHRNGCHGVPDIIIEIVSQGSISLDYIKKLNLYNDFGVREYWIVDPLKKTILVYILENGAFTHPNMYTFDETVPVSILYGLEIDFSKIELLSG